MNARLPRRKIATFAFIRVHLRLPILSPPTISIFLIRLTDKGDDAPRSPTVTRSIDVHKLIEVIEHTAQIGETFVRRCACEKVERLAQFFAAGQSG